MIKLKLYSPLPSFNPGPFYLSKYITLFSHTQKTSNKNSSFPPLPHNSPIQVMWPMNLVPRHTVCNRSRAEMPVLTSVSQVYWRWGDIFSPEPLFETKTRIKRLNVSLLKATSFPNDSPKPDVVFFSLCCSSRPTSLPQFLSNG